MSVASILNLPLCKSALARTPVPAPTSKTGPFPPAKMNSLATDKCNSYCISSIKSES